MITCEQAGKRAKGKPVSNWILTSCQLHSVTSGQTERSKLDQGDENIKDHDLHCFPLCLVETVSSAAETALSRVRVLPVPVVWVGAPWPNTAKLPWLVHASAHAHFSAPAAVAQECPAHTLCLVQQKQQQQFRNAQLTHCVWCNKNNSNKSGRPSSHSCVWYNKNNSGRPSSHTVSGYNKNNSGIPSSHTASGSNKNNSNNSGMLTHCIWCNKNNNSGMPSSHTASGTTKTTVTTQECPAHILHLVQQKQQ